MVRWKFSRAFKFEITRDSMVIDTSALIAILLNEPEASEFVDVITKDPVRKLSAPSFHEASTVMFHKVGPAGVEDLDRLISTLKISVVPFEEEHVEYSREGQQNYGAGFHPAKLNLGDCFSYALAKETGESLLFKGNDFNQTDIPAVII